MNNPTPRPPLAIAIAPAAMMLIAIVPLPYGYYQLLRLVVAVCGLWIAYVAWQDRKVAWALVIGVTILVFNPLIPIHFDRQTWSVLNVIGALVFAAVGWAFIRRAPTGPS